MAVNRQMGKRKGFADYIIERRLKEGDLDREPLMVIDRLGRELGLWRTLQKELEEMYSAEGRPGYPPLALFKCLLIELLYGISDIELERHLRWNFLFLKFVGLSLNDPVPDHSTLSVFRKRLAEKKPKLLDSAFGFVKAQLAKRGLALRKGVIVDATIVPASKDSSGAEEGRKGTGYKLHLAADEETLLAVRVELSSARPHDVNFILELVPPGAKRVLADKAYDSEEVRETLRKLGIKPNIMRRETPNLPNISKFWNRVWGRARLKIEAVFAILKNNLGLGWCRWKREGGFETQALLAVILWNLLRGYRLLRGRASPKGSLA